MAQKREIVGFAGVAEVPAAIDSRLDQPLQRAPSELLGCDLPFRRLAPGDPVPGLGEARRIGAAAQAIGGLARHPHAPRRRADRPGQGQRGEERGLAPRSPAIAAGAQRNGKEGGNAGMAGAARAVARITLHPTG